MANGWGVYNLSGNLVFDVDTVLDLKQSAKAKASTFPVEKGTFATYNKVIEPWTNKIRLAVGGKARMAAFMAALQSELSQANLYNVVTPTVTYMNCTLEGYDYSQAAEAGLNLLVVDLSLLQVREVTPTYTALPVAKVGKATSASKQVNGKAQPQKPAGPPPLAWNNAVSRAEND